MKQKNLGILLGLSCYLLWSLLSIFWKLLAGVSAYDVFAYRILFTLVTMAAYMLMFGHKERYKKELVALVKDKKQLVAIIAASLFISLNWLTYIYAVGHGQATDASLGYYMMPLVSVLLSVVFLKEKLNRSMYLALGLAFLGVLALLIASGQLPSISIILAFSFGIYGLLKKNVSLSSDVSMLVESLILSPIALGFLFFLSKETMLDYSLTENILLCLSGLVTAIPLLLFAEALKRAPLNTIGFIQYLNPTFQLVIAVTLFKETIDQGQLYGFAFIWLAILVFVLGQLIQLKKERQH